MGVISKKQVQASKQVRCGLKKKKVLGPKTGWVFFCNERREQTKKENPGIKFGDINKLLSKPWQMLSAADKNKFLEMAKDDKRRYENEIASLTSEEKRAYRCNNSKGPKKVCSAYMCFVRSQRPAICANNPGMSFQEIGKQMGLEWKSLSNEDKKKYIDMHLEDKIRYQADVVKWQAAKEKRHASY